MKEVEEYIAQFDPEIQERLTSIRQLFFDQFPDVEESIRYNMPAYKVGKHYLYFSAYKKHIGFYPVNELPGMEEELASYRAAGTKDTLHFLHNRPLPINMIKEIIKMKFQS